ncbi:glycosyltransferase family 4 protein [Acinetobacter pseudolwoffii]|uniref:glycosyltransferase family 4 protein n=1 Tax=Acinetobacter pseudolwoffii TaxID=2053287 RepID=UPI0025774235|nr:glycosyltransferase family 4 protein [Acinetobacter pseudolwoffii]MDM1335774.1 glycosyltransferase family 4 protein [Acinetobacter pseudolwoffii]
MKFMIVTSHLPSIINFRGKLLEAINSKGCEIHIIAPNDKSFLSEELSLKKMGYFIHKVHMERTGKNFISDFFTLMNIISVLIKEKPNYLLAYTIKPVIYGILAATLTKVPKRFALITGLGYAFKNVDKNSKRTIFQKIVHGFYKKALSHTHKVFFQNPDDLNLFNDLEILKKHTPTVVVNGSGVNLKHFDIISLPSNVKNETKISFLLIARLLIDKGVREYVQAAEIIKQKYPDVEFNLVGWIDKNPTAITQAELDRWTSNQTLKYWGKLSDVRPAIAASSVYVLPSYREGTPRTVLEAMAMGRAIITTDAPGCRETVVDGDNGFLVEVKSVQSLVEAMQKFINRPELIKTMGQRSRQIALDKYDVHQVNQHMMQEMGLI